MSDELVKLTVAVSTPALRAQAATAAVQLVSSAPHCWLSARSASMSAVIFAEAT